MGTLTSIRRPLMRAIIYASSSHLSSFFHPRRCHSFDSQVASPVTRTNESFGPLRPRQLKDNCHTLIFHRSFLQSYSNPSLSPSLNCAARQSRLVLGRAREAQGVVLPPSSNTCRVLAGVPHPDRLTTGGIRLDRTSRCRSMEGI